MSRPSRMGLGFLGGCVVGIGVMLSLGAQDKPARAYARYSVGGTQDHILVVDNDKDKLYRYTMRFGKDKATDRFVSVAVLESTFDLTQAGKPQVRER